MFIVQGMSDCGSARRPRCSWARRVLYLPDASTSDSISTTAVPMCCERGEHGTSESLSESTRSGHVLGSSSPNGLPFTKLKRDGSHESSLCDHMSDTISGYTNGRRLDCRLRVHRNHTRARNMKNRAQGSARKRNLTNAWRTIAVCGLQGSLSVCQSIALSTGAQGLDSHGC